MCIFYERILKKDGESMCNLGLYHHLYALEKYVEAKEPLPKAYISVMDTYYRIKVKVTM